MAKQLHRPNVSKGVLLPLGNGFSLAIGKNPNKTDDIDIGPNNKNGLSVNHGEILEQKGNAVRVYSAEPMLNGESPASLLYRGANPNAVFTAQEIYKDINNINDDGSKQHAQFGILKKIKEFINKRNNNDNKEVPLKKIDWSNIKTTNNRAYNQEYIDYINNGLVNYGYNNNQRAAILANIIEESGGDPFAEGPGGYYGLLQWGSNRYIKNKEKDAYKEIDNQLKYLNNTINNTEDKKSWTHGGTGSGYNSFNDAINAYNSDDLNKVMHGFTWGYVRPAGKQNSYLNRQKVADQLINREGFNRGGIYIKPSKRGTFTAAAKKHGMSVQGFANKVLANKENYSSAMIKKANFAKNASKWHHLFGGEDTLINPLGERPNANNENMSNKRTKAVAGTQQPLRTLAEIQAAKEQFGKYYNIFYNNDGTIKRQIPTFGELTGTTLSKADQTMYKKIWGDDFYNRNVDSSGKFVGSGMKPITLNNDDIYANQIKIGDKIIRLNQDPNTNNYIGAHIVNGDGTLLRDNIVPPNTQPTNNNTNDIGNNWFKDNKADLVGAGINALGSIGGAIINAIGIGRQRYIPRRGIVLTPSKLKTKININPQLAQMRETLSQIEQGARNNSASSRNVYDRILRARTRGIQSYNSLLGDKENRETALINQDRLNQQQVRARNVQNFQNIMNTNISGREALNNRKTEAHAENAVALLNNLAGIVTGERGLLAREDARRRTAADLTMMSLAYPDAAKLITEHPELHDQFYDNYYGMLGSNRFYRRRNG